MKFKSVTTRTNEMIFHELKDIVDCIGLEQFEKYHRTMLKDKNYYSIKDFYEGLITYVKYCVQEDYVKK